MFTAYLGLGSNLGECASHLRSAIAWLDLHEAITVTQRAAIYQSPATGMAPGTPDFLNTVIAVQTLLPPETLLAKCLEIENQMGRDRTIPSTLPLSRIIDIDLLLYENWILNLPTLTLPHPQLHLRAFVLQPLWELLAQTDPELRHPLLQEKIVDLLRRSEVVDVYPIQV